MPTFDERPSGILTVRHSLWVELLGMAMMAAGLALLSGCLVWWFGGSARAWGRLAALGVSGVALLLIGANCFFDEERLVLDKRSGTLFLRRPFRRVRHWDFQAVEKVELAARRPAATPDARAFKECTILFKGGARLRVYRGRAADLDELATRLAAFIEVPLEKR